MILAAQPGVRVHGLKCIRIRLQKHILNKPTNPTSINMAQLKNCLLATPSLQKQHRIVAKVDELVALCDKLKSRITQASQLQQKLADAVVEQALAS